MKIVLLTDLHISEKEDIKQKQSLNNAKVAEILAENKIEKIFFVVIY